METLSFGMVIGCFVGCVDGLNLRDLFTVAYWAISLVEKTAVWTVATMVFPLAVSSAADVVDEMVVN